MSQAQDISRPPRRPTSAGQGNGGEPSHDDRLLDVDGAAEYLGVTAAFVRRLVLEKRIRYYKLGKFVRFRTGDLDAFVEAGRHEPVDPWVHAGSTARGATGRASAQRTTTARPLRSASSREGKASRS